VEQAGRIIIDKNFVIRAAFSELLLMVMGGVEFH
jgi:hypothetical protein